MTHLIKSLRAFKKQDSLQGIPGLKSLGWRVIDAKEQVLGRLSAQIARVLLGKDKPTYDPTQERADMVVVLNAKDVKLTGKKLDKMVYRWHTGWPGGLHEQTAKHYMDKEPSVLIRHAVLGMLPRNALFETRSRKLRIFPGEEHPFKDKPLVPLEMPPRRVSKPWKKMPGRMAVVKEDGTVEYLN
eukprot:jgi/Mesvir1/15825/Mv03378-RA.1